MTDILFEWGEAKSLKNKKKHGISFEEASSAFYDERGLLISDPDHSEGGGPLHTPWYEFKITPTRGVPLLSR